MELEIEYKPTALSGRKEHYMFYLEKISNLRFEVTVKKDRSREVVASALVENGEKMQDFLKKNVETLGLNEEGIDENGDTYTVFIEEYNIRLNKYLRTSRYNGVLRTFILGLNTKFESPHILTTKDITSTVNLAKKRMAVIDKIEQCHCYFGRYSYGEHYVIHFKDGTTADCSVKMDFNSAIDEHIKAS